MSKEEMRKERKGGMSAAGGIESELAQLERMQRNGKNMNKEIGTITVGCGGVYTLICC